MKIPHLGAESFHADRRAGGRTDGHYEANSRFSQFCERALKAAFILMGLSKEAIISPCTIS